MCESAGLQMSSLSGHRMTTGFGPFELPTRGLLLKGQDHSPPKACFEDTMFIFSLLGDIDMFSFILGEVQ